MSLSPKARATMEQATHQYEADVAQIKDYLIARGIDGATAKKFRLGYVANPIIGHEQYRNRLAIPYITPTGIVDIRFRCVEQHSCKDHNHPKYLSQPGHRTRLYYTNSVMEATDTIAIVEGELDAVILNKIGIPAVGIAGAQGWQSDYYPKIFSDFANVFVFGDGDEAGQNFARSVVKSLEDATIIDMPTGMDVTDIYLAMGEDDIKKRCGLLEAKVAIPDYEDVF